MIEIPKLAGNLYCQDNIWYAHGKSEKISYPIETSINSLKIEDKSYWFRHRQDLILHLANKFCSTKDFFDVGGGNGSISIALQNSGFDVCLIEPQASAINEAKTRGVKKLINASFNDLSIEANAIHNIGLFDVIEHVENDSDFLKNLNHSMLPGGKLLVTVPAFAFLWSATDCHAGHYRRYSRKTLSELLENSGFKVLYVSYLFHYLLLPIFLFRAVPFLFSKKIGKRKPRKSNYAPKAQLVNHFINTLNHFESTRIKTGKSIKFGSTCILVAEKCKNE